MVQSENQAEERPVLGGYDGNGARHGSGKPAFQRYLAQSFVEELGFRQTGYGGWAIGP